MIIRNYRIEACDLCAHCARMMQIRKSKNLENSLTLVIFRIIGRSSSLCSAHNRGVGPCFSQKQTYICIWPTKFVFRNPGLRRFLKKGCNHDEGTVKRVRKMKILEIVETKLSQCICTAFPKIPDRKRPSLVQN